MVAHKMVTLAGVRYRVEDAPNARRSARPRAAVVPEPAAAAESAKTIDTEPAGVPAEVEKPANAKRRRGGGRNRS